jgi:hypothetical protein
MSHLTVDDLSETEKKVIDEAMAKLDAYLAITQVVWVFDGEVGK